MDRTASRGDERWTTVGRTGVHTPAGLACPGYPWLGPQREGCSELRGLELSPVSTDLTKTAENKFLKTDPELLMSYRQRKRTAGMEGTP